MSPDYKTTIIEKVMGSVPMLTIAVGTGFTVLGLAGGITYHHWLPIQDVISRLLSGAIGLGLIALGLQRSFALSTARLEPREFGIKIRYPSPGSRVSTVDVGGSIEKSLPDGYCLRVFRIRPGSNKLRPLCQARIDIHAKTWVAERCQMGGNKDDQRFFAAYICGPNAEVLVEFYDEAATVHRATMTDYEKVSGKKAAFLPAISGRTADMYECDRVPVVRS